MLPASSRKVGLRAAAGMEEPPRVWALRLQVTLMSGTGLRRAPMFTASQDRRKVPSTGRGGSKVMVMLLSE